VGCAARRARLTRCAPRFQVFRLIDIDRSSGTNVPSAPVTSSTPGYLDIDVPEGDHRITFDEWSAALPRLHHAANTWAPFVALREASEEDFGRIDQNGGGVVDLQEVA
jgi:hypothetical protein